MTEMVMMIIGAVRQGMGSFGMVGCRVSQGWGTDIEHMFWGILTAYLSGFMRSGIPLIYTDMG